MNSSERAVILVKNLSKRYGRIEAIDDVSFEIPRGSIFGLLGTNGAGKTTTFKCMLGLARADRGRVELDGAPLRPKTFEELAYVPETNALYDWMTGNDHLEFTRRSFRGYDAARARALIDTFQIDPTRKAAKLSKGQQSALALTLAFSIRPRLLVLDEPSAGLDPLHQRHVLDLLIDAAASGATVLLSSHQIGQVERAADHVAILHQGKIVIQGEVDQLKANEKIVEATFDPRAPELRELEADSSVRRIVRNGRIVRAFVRGNPDEVARRINAAAPTSIRVLDQNLEDIFVTAVGVQASADPAREA
mgnify:CR=1 FL=1